MNVVGKVGSLISQGVYSVATPLHPFGGAVDVIVVLQQDGTYRSTPWYVRFGKFQGVLKGAEKNVRIIVNGIEANFHMHLDNSGEAYFVREVDSGDSGKTYRDMDNSELNGSIEVADVKDEVVFPNPHDGLDAGHIKSSPGSSSSDVLHASDNEFSCTNSQDYPLPSSECDAYCYGSFNQRNDSSDSDSEVVLMSGDGQVLLAPIPSCEENSENVRLTTPHFGLYLGDDEGVTIEQVDRSDDGECTERGAWVPSSLGNIDSFATNHQHEYSLSSRCLPDAYEGTQEISYCKTEPGNIFNTSLVDSNVCTVEGVTSRCVASELISNANESYIQLSNSISVECVDDKLPFSQHTPRSLVDEVNYPDDHIFCGCASSCPPIAHHTAGDSEYIENLCEALASNSSDCKDRHHFLSEELQSKHDGRSNLAGCEISLCGDLLYAGMGIESADAAFNAHLVTLEEFRTSAASIVKNEKLIVRVGKTYLPWSKAAPILLGMVAFNIGFPAEPEGSIAIEQVEKLNLGEEENSAGSVTSSRRWTLWPILFRRTKSLRPPSGHIMDENLVVDSGRLEDQHAGASPSGIGDDVLPKKEFVRTYMPTNEEISSLNLKDGQNKITFNFSTRVLGEQQVDAHIYLWKWDAKIVVSDVDGTITKSDVLGQFMPLLGKDWTQSGVARLFSAIKGNGYQLLFLSARAIVQAYLTRSFLLNLKQDGETLPKGPVVISPNGLIPSLYREVIRRTPHEFKIACLEEIRALFPHDCNPFYAGFGNRETDEISYKKVGIPDGKIFIINPKGEVAINRCVATKSYTSLHTLANDMFPPTSLAEHEDFNSWNYWKIPVTEVGC